jgi:hypothetical protein
VAKKAIPFPGRKAAPLPGNNPDVKAPEPAPDDGSVMAALRERRDAAIARRLTVQNAITRGALISRETVKAALGRIRGARQSVIPEASYSTASLVLAVIEEKDITADAALRLLLDREAYAAGGRINGAMEKWIRLQKAPEDDAGGGVLRSSGLP